MSPGRAPARLARRALLALGLAGLVLSAPAPQGAEPGEPAIPEAVGYVNDLAEVMDQTARAKLEAFLDQLEKKTGAEFAVLTVRTTAPLAPQEYKVRVFERWGIGKKHEDNGLLMLVAVEEREVRFETGYGLEGTLPDGLESRIFREQMLPRIRAGDFSGAITGGALACAVRIAAEKGVSLEWDGRELRYERPSRLAPGRSALIALVVFVLLALAISASASRPFRRRRGWYAGPRGLGGWGGWGGGFGGGGFGGGGSFGGFGGGASGGGGGGGRW